MKTLKENTVLDLSILIKIIQSLWISHLAKIKTSVVQVVDYSVPKVVQLVYRYRTKIWTSSGQALVSINKHIQTITNRENINKQEKEKKENYLLEFLTLKFLKKSRTSNRYKFYELKNIQTKIAVGQNWNMLQTTFRRKFNHVYSTLDFEFL